MRDAQLSGVQRGVGLRVDNDGAFTGLDFTMAGGSISDFQKNATRINGAHLDISGVHITGAGNTGILAQNGFQILNSSGYLHDNIIDEIGYNGVAGDTYATAVLLYDNGDLHILNNNITGGNIDGIDSRVLGIYEFSSSGTVSGGEIAGNTLDYVDLGVGLFGNITPDAVLVHDNTVNNLDYSDAATGGGAGVYFQPDSTVTADFNVSGTGETDYLLAAGGNDTLHGLGGDDYLDGGAGANTLIGGDGNDTFVVNSLSDVVTEDAGAAAGTADTVIANFENYTLAANVETLQLGAGIHAGAGNGSANMIVGNAEDNVLTGGGGDDSIDGDAGTDTAVFAGTFAGHSISFAGGHLTVVDTNTADGDTGTDTLVNVERLTFGDTHVLIVDAGGAYGSFTSIQAAVDAAAAGDTIIVRAGTYAEDLSITKNVTILGAFAGVDGADGLRTPSSAAGETNIIGHMTISSSALVTLDGLRFEETMQTGLIGLVHLTSGNLLAENNIFWSDVQGGNSEVRAIYLSPNAGGTAKISHNYITGAFASGYSGASFERGIWYDGGDGSGLIADHNTIQNTRSAFNLDMSGDSSAAIDYNSFNTDGTGVAVGIDDNGVSFLGNAYTATGDEFSFRNLTDAVTFDAHTAVAAHDADYVVVLGGAGGDTLTGTEFNDYLEGNQLNPVNGTDADTLHGAGGNDYLLGEGGDDVLDGGAGLDTMIGGSGNDIYYVDNAGDVVSEDANAGADLVHTTLASYTLGANVENLTFDGAGAFSGFGNDLANTIIGGDGNDRLTGNGGNDILIGGAGNDVLNGGGQADIMRGGDGNDTYMLSSNNNVVDETGGSGVDTVVTDKFTLNLTHYAGIENATLRGGSDLNLVGDAGDNRLVGNTGNNVITGGLGADILAGGDGNDRFRYTSTDESGTSGMTRDIIRDFAVGHDLIDLLGIDAKVNSPNNNAFTFIGTDQFTAEGQVRVAYNGSNTIIELNTSGSSGAEMHILLQGHITLDDSSFVL